MKTTYSGRRPTRFNIYRDTSASTHTSAIRVHRSGVNANDPETELLRYLDVKCIVG